MLPLERNIGRKIYRQVKKDDASIDYTKSSKIHTYDDIVLDYCRVPPNHAISGVRMTMLSYTW